MRHQSTVVPIRVLVSDDSRVHTELLADALKRDGSLQVTTSSSGSESLISRANLHDVDVFLLSSNLDEQPGRGFEVLRSLYAAKNDLRAVMLLDSSKRETVLEAFRSGAQGVFSRTESMDTSASACAASRRARSGPTASRWRSWPRPWPRLTTSRRGCAGHGTAVQAGNGSGALRGPGPDQPRDRRPPAPQPAHHQELPVPGFDKLGVSSRVELLFMTFSQDSRRSPPSSSSSRTTTTVSSETKRLCGVQESRRAGRADRTTGAGAVPCRAEERIPPSS